MKQLLLWIIAIPMILLAVPCLVVGFIVGTMHRSFLRGYYDVDNVVARIRNVRPRTGRFQDREIDFW